MKNLVITSFLVDCCDVDEIFSMGPFRERCFTSVVNSNLSDQLYFMSALPRPHYGEVRTPRGPKIWVCWPLWRHKRFCHEVELQYFVIDRFWTFCKNVQIRRRTYARTGDVELAVGKAFQFWSGDWDLPSSMFVPAICYVIRYR